MQRRVGLCAALVLAGACARAANRQPAPVRADEPGRTAARPRAFTVVPLGLCEDYPEESRTIEEARADLALARSIGIRVLRVSIGWDGVEPRRGQYDLDFWDRFVDEADRAGVRLIPYVAYTPRWIARSTDADYWRHPPRDPAAFGELMTVLARRYRGRIDSWELWNEPDNPDYWRGTPGDFAALLAAGARAVHAAAPDARVVFGGIAGHPAFMTEVLARPALGPMIDVINAHAYFETWNSAPLETLPAYADALSPALRRSPGQSPRPLWLAEVGYAGYRRGPEISPAYRARFRHEHTPAFQAVVLLRTVALALSLPEVRLFAWYEVKDPPPAAPVIGDDNNRHLGILFADRRPKPALAALALASRLFGDGFARLDQQMRMASSSSARIEAHAFLSVHCQAIVVAWLPTWADDLASARQADSGEALDTRVESIAIELPLTAVGPARSLDTGGHERARMPASASASGPSTLRLDGITLRGGDVTILEIPIAPVACRTNERP